MKKILALIILVLSTFICPYPSYAQVKNVKKDPNKKPEIIRDRFMLDFFHTFWMGTPGEINAKKFHPGFNVAGMYDFKLPNDAPFSFGLGLGFSYYTLYSNATLLGHSGSGRLRSGAKSPSAASLLRVSK